MEDQIPGWECFGMDDSSHFPSVNTAQDDKSIIPSRPSNSNSIQSYLSYDSGIGILNFHFNPRLRRPSFSYDDDNAAPAVESELQQRANKPRFTCRVCSDKARKTYGARNSLKRHISEQHYPQSEMSCPYGDWVGTSRAKLRQHFRTAHSDKSLPRRGDLEANFRPYEVPVSCALCGRIVRSWDEFYKCLLRHCEMEETMGATTQCPPKEQAERADGSNTPLPSAVHLEMLRMPTNELMVKTDGDLACDELLNNYLDRSDFVFTFSLDIYKKAHPPRHDAKRVAVLLSDLPDFLRYFAEKLSFKGSKPYQRFSLMVCNHAGDIAKAVCNYYTNGITDRPANPGWSLYLTTSADLNSPATSGQRKLHYSELLEQFPAYRWLVGCVRKILTLGTVGENVMQDVARAISLQFPSSKVDWALPPTLYDADFVLDWNPRSFLRVQEYAGDPVNIVDHVITLTGSLDNAQALTCVQYMRQTWPESSDCVISLLHKLLEARESCSSSGSLQDGTVLTGAFDGCKVVVHLQGLQHAIVEIGQQLAWLGAALQSAPDNRIAYCRPVLTNTYTFMTNLRYELKFTFQHAQSGLPRCNGRCWHSLFNNPVVVSGFPIRQRQLQNTGLDTPLNILGRLVPSRRIAHFGGKVCIKGHCTILVPTKIVGDAVIWHLICNDHGSYMDYTDSRIDAIPGLYPAGIDTNLMGFRHIVGWCPEAQVLTASPGAEYGIDWSGLNRADTGCDLRDVIISRGTIIQNYETPAIGNKDRPSHSEFGEYLHRILSVTKKYAVFYDVSTRQAWLVDGASALLHLVRASLLLSSSEDPMQEFVFRPELLEQHPSPKGGRVSAISVLKSEKNLNQRLHRNMPETFQDRVEAIYHLLEQAYAYQTRAKLQKSAGIAPGCQARTLLEGFDFMDLAADEDHFNARTMSAFDGPPRWHRLTGAINAITLFGRGFGNLLKPKEMVPVCSSWTTVPSGKDYLAARVEDILTIMRKKGNILGSPWRVIDDVYWHIPDKLFENCQCIEDCSRERCSHAQALLIGPEITTQASGIVSPVRLEPDGAIIFDGFPVNSLLPTPEISFSSTLSGFKSPANDSAISVGYSPGSGNQESGSSKAEGKRPVNGRSTVPNPRKRMRRESSNSSSDIYHTERVSEFRRPSRNESFLTSGSSSQGSSSDSLWESRFETNIPNRIMEMEIAKNIELDPAEYKVGWICALQIELDAAQKMLDRIHTKGFGQGMDHNLYILGQIGQLNVVLTCLPMGQYGNNIAAVVATHMMNRFPRIAIGLMVGIGGGLPSAKNDIRLGDVVVSIPHLQYGGVVQYDMGKFTSDGFITTGSLKAPPKKLLQVLNFMPRHGSPIAGPPDIEYPGVELDLLFESSYAHTGGGDTCISCDAQQVIPRPMTRTTTSPRVFYGTIASGNSVVKNSKMRGILIQKHGVLCCEMEAAGLMNTRFPCLVIRGITDYADSHKNEIWMEYAAAAAAQYARDLLQAMPPDLALQVDEGILH
ncbi:hypothetical protein P170DRAFT_440709 [Aspergillus steynii IBT 23096]|uniref:Nucleoside phosphorylase domain-containing protein n=1 Tax=Aspergillus steynii IBT 23096 TaxID=1392250 RepID=A0A2I2FUU4_9EURO|nr:uncharacterized protein P170DRAFT_440709 [Aspergillus steynii IBT 23096]PLB44410.1 hypothetical protein P170DRAFT_440709 [Aspergillus steynii IBT 23096]